MISHFISKFWQIQWQIVCFHHCSPSLSSTLFPHGDPQCFHSFCYSCNSWVCSRFLYSACTSISGQKNTFNNQTQHMVSLERAMPSGENPQMLLSYCRELKTFYRMLLSAQLIQLTSIKKWKKYSIHWLQNFLTVKNFVQLADRPTLYEEVRTICLFCLSIQ